MSESKISEEICKSIFKNGKTATTKQDFTKTWSELVNTLEKNAGFVLEKNHGRYPSNAAADSVCLQGDKK